MAALGLATLAAKVAADAGGPRGLLTAIQVATIGVIGFLAADPLRRRWLDARRAILLSLAILLAPTVYGEVGGDGWQAFAVVRSVLIDHDLDLANDYAGLRAPVTLTASGRATSHLPIGLALVWTPPFLLAHLGTGLAAALGAHVAADGFAVPYRSAVTAGTYVYGVIALLLLESELRRRVGAAAALLAVLAIWLATPLHFYMTANPAMAHGASVFVATAFVVAWLRVRERESASGRAWAMVGLLGGLMTVVRLQDAVLLALPAVDLLWRRPPGWAALLARYVPAAALFGFLQLAVWWRLYGGDFLSTVLAVNLVGGIRPQVMGVLLSARHGLFYWTPLYLACVLGWILLARRDRRIGALFAVGFAASVLVNASMQDWWGAEAFGQRRLLGLTPLFALGLGEVLGALAPRGRAVAAGGLALLALWTLGFEGIYNSAVVAPRDQAITYDRLAVAQVDALRRRVVSRHGRWPSALWVFAYDRLGGTWLDGADRSLGGRVDLGSEPESLPFLVGRGWYDPETEGEVTLRRSRGNGSWIRVPIRKVAEYEAVVRLRPELPDVPLRITFEVNREPVGVADVRAGWSEYRFTVPSRVLRRGLNDLGIIYSTTPRQARPEVAARNAAVGVDWIELAPVRP